MRRFQCALFAAVTVIGFGSLASAGDLPVKGPIVAPVAPYSWTGCYAGAIGGYQWGRSKQSYGGLIGGAPNPFLPTGFDMTNNYDVNGGQIGGTLGCNYQTGNWVFGVEGDGSLVATSVREPPSANAIALGLNPNFRFTTEQKWMATGRGRIGYAWDRWLVYGTGGAVFGGFDLNNYGTALAALRVPSRVNKVGWIAGLGTEYHLDRAWSVKAEGLYADYGTMHYGDEPGTANGCPAGCANGDVKMKSFMFRVGFNYKFM
jgi:outer membrane immunogenic protein